jgi:HSP20 family protein
MTMLMRTDPYGALDALTQQLFGGGSWSRPAAMPVDAYRVGDEFMVHFDLPGVDPDSIEVSVQHNTLTVNAERKRETSEHIESVVSERPFGAYSRQLYLGETLDADHITADCDAGVLTLRIPVAEKTKPRKIEISGGGERKSITT